MKYLMSMLGLGLLLVFVTSLAESSLRSILTNYGANTTADGNDLHKNTSCLILCNYCGCDGSIVGNDCICDCGIDGKEHIKCLEKIDSNDQQIDFELFDDEESSIGDDSDIQRRIRREAEDDTMGPAGADRKLNRKNKRKKVNRRRRGRRFLQMLTSGSNKNKE